MCGDDDAVPIFGLFLQDYDHFVKVHDPKYFHRRMEITCEEYLSDGWMLQSPSVAISDHGAGVDAAVNEDDYVDRVDVVV